MNPSSSPNYTARRRFRLTVGQALTSHAGDLRLVICCLVLSSIEMHRRREAHHSRIILPISSRRPTSAVHLSQRVGRGARQAQATEQRDDALGRIWTVLAVLCHYSCSLYPNPGDWVAGERPLDGFAHQKYEHMHTPQSERPAAHIIHSPCSMLHAHWFLLVEDQ